MRRICLITRDAVTAAYFEALLHERASLTVTEGTRRLPDTDLFVLDTDSILDPIDLPAHLPRLTVGSDGTPDLLRPFTDRVLLARLLPESTEGARPHLLPSGQCLVAGGGEYRLSDTEYRLLSELFRAEGEEVDCETLFSRVWEGREMNLNLLRVTVSHLRQRLKDAELSISSTRGGYRLEL